MKLFHFYGGVLRTKMPFAFYIDFYDGYNIKLRTERGVVWAYHQKDAEEIVELSLASGKCFITVKAISFVDELTII